MLTTILTKVFVCESVILPVMYASTLVTTKTKQNPSKPQLRDDKWNGYTTTFKV